MVGVPKILKDPTLTDEAADIEKMPFETALAELESEVRAELDDAVEFARSSPQPDPAEALEDIYA